MEFDGTDPQYLRLKAIPSPLGALIAAIPSAAECEEGDAAASRIYPLPSEAIDEQLHDDWKAYVVPEMEHLFRGSREIVQKDLENLHEHGDEERLVDITFPRIHAEAWLHCLNQARLVLAAKINYQEGDGANFHLTSPPADRQMKVFQIEFYAFLQEWLLDSIAS